MGDKGLHWGNEGVKFTLSKGPLYVHCVEGQGLNIHSPLGDKGLNIHSGGRQEVRHMHTYTHTHTLHRGRVVHYIAAHIEEISENGADVAHLTALHQPGIIGGGGLDFAETWLSKLHSHNWTATWKSKTESLRYVCVCVCVCIVCQLPGCTIVSAKI